MAERNRSVFLPILDEGGVVAHLRRQALTALGARSEVFRGLEPPRAVHSTIARFRTTPAAPSAFVDRFQAWARDRELGRARVDAILVTAEARPYMREGRIVDSFGL